MRARISLLLAALVAVPAVAARGGMPEPLTPRGSTIESIYFQIFVAGVIVFLFVMGWMLVAMWRYRADGGAGRETYEMERDNLKLELAWISVPLAVVMWVGVISYAGLVELDEGIHEDDVFMELDVTGFQWTWRADYGSGVQMFSDPSNLDGSVADENVFKVPADVPIKFNLTSADVIHAWHLMDANWGTVGLVDANPYGPHKYTSMTMELPRGEYKVQCREMCFNPGHAYMRARVEAVPMGEFQDWLGFRGLSAGAELAQETSLTLDGDGFDAPADVNFVAGESARAVVTLENTDDEARSVSVPGMTLLTSRVETAGNDIRIAYDEHGSLDVPPGGSLSFAFDVPEAGEFQFVSGGDTLDFEVIEAQLVEMELGDFFVEPAQLTLEADTTYLFQVQNTGQASHNLFLGDKPDAQQQTVYTDANDQRAASATIGGGQSTSFVVTTRESGELDMWCDVPGHWGEGMFGTVSVQ